MSALTDRADAATTVLLGVATAGRCRRRVHLDHDPDIDRTRQRRPDPGLQLRLDTLAAHRRAIRDAVAGAMPLAEGWRPDSDERPAAVWSARLTAGNRVATVELLLRAPDGGYVPVLVRGHRTTDPGVGALLTPVPALPQAMSGGLAMPTRAEVGKKLRPHHRDVLALAHVYRMLQELGLGSAEAFGGIIGFGGPSADPNWDDAAAIAWHRLDTVSGGIIPLADYDERFTDRLEVAQAAASRAPALAQPSKISECRVCPWWTVCGPELEAAHDVSLLVAGQDVEILRSVGVTTYDDVAAMDAAVIGALPLTGIPAREAHTRAQAMRAQVPMVRRRERVDVIRADVELDIDMESYLDDGAYLWGTLLTGAALDGFEAGYRPFATWAPLASPATATNFVEFWNYLGALRVACASRGLTFAAYCYSHKAEERWLYGTPARFPNELGMPTRGEVAAFCDSEQWVDLYQEVKRLFVVPGSLRLKSVAPIAGFAWRDPEPGGENSMAWYRVAISDSHDVTGQDAAPGSGGTVEHTVAYHRQRIIRYNEDDVRATYALRHWMSTHPDAMPTVADLGRG